MLRGWVGGGGSLSYYQYFQPGENTKLPKEIKIITDMLRFYSVFVFFTQYWQMTPSRHFSWIPLWWCLSYVCILFPSFGRWWQCALKRLLACVMMFCVESSLFHNMCYRAVWSWSQNILFILVMFDSRGFSLDLISIFSHLKIKKLQDEICVSTHVLIL